MLALSTLAFIVAASFIIFNVSHSEVTLHFTSFGNPEGKSYYIFMKELILPFAGTYEVTGSNVTILTLEGSFNGTFMTRDRAVGVISVQKVGNEQIVRIIPRIGVSPASIVVLTLIGVGWAYAVRVLKLE
ncbi:hypothetical protein [Thermococcus waiotapuensis]|uniref:Uncharacterized protein n=1 Tax=Thermococcus waiotapuensis TaxID=90909 RepID=A0AAE4SYZ1_9EURY|nr:hypothetical protein [Thermococcus waiotapuensis]MDV3104244.1 hypothetical protein [Thermococcus waiotapuensis]